MESRISLRFIWAPAYEGSGPGSDAARAVERLSSEKNQNSKPSFTSTQRPFLTCWTWVTSVAR
jgi:hypothetical protein